MVTLELMKAISAAFNSRDVDRIVSFFAEDGVFCLSRGPEPVGRTLRGKATIRKALADRFVQIPDMRWENEEYILARGARPRDLGVDGARQGRRRRGAQLPGLRHLHLQGRQDRPQEHVLEDRRKPASCCDAAALAIHSVHMHNSAPLRAATIRLVMR